MSVRKGVEFVRADGAESPDLAALGRAVSSAAVCVLALDADDRIVAINPAGAALLGRAADELLGTDAHAAVHGDAHADCALAAALRDRVPAESNADEFVRANDSTATVWWIYTPGPDSTLIFRGVPIDRVSADVAAADHARGRAQLARSAADLVEARQSVADWRWLAELMQSMSASLDETEVMLRLARMIAGRIADVAVVDVVARDFSIRRVGGAVAPGIDLDLDAVLARPDITHDVEVRSPSTQTVLSGRLHRLSGAAIDNPAVLGPSTRVMLREIGAESVIIAPLVARERVVGALVLVRRDGRPAFDEFDDVLCADIARRAALAVDNAHLYHAQTAIALQLQHALLPEPAEHPMIRSAVRYLPARNQFDVGGDWYDLFHCAGSRERTVLLIGDVAGHDLRAATTMAAIRNLLRGIAVATDMSCAGVIDAVDSNLPALGITGTASAVLMSVEPAGADWHLTWSNAGHMPPVLILPGRRVELLEEVHGPILGAHMGTERGETARVIPGGSTLILYTDGLVETRTEPIDASLVRLRQVALAVADLVADPQALLDELVRRNHASTEDDTAILVCHLPAQT